MSDDRMDVTGWLVLVTGGGSGLGLAMATAFGEAGAIPILADIDLATARGAAAALGARGIAAHAIALDVGKAESWAAAKTAVDAIGELRILCNNAGTGSSQVPVEQVALDDWHWVFSVNVDGPLHGVKTFLPGMKAGGKPCWITNTASMIGLFPTPGPISYITSKYAEVGFTLGLRNELHGTNVGLSLIAPGMMRTRLVENSVRLSPAHGGEMDEAIAAKMNRMLSRSMDPVLVGRFVVDAVLARRFYILPHAEWQGLVERQTAELLAAFGGSADPEHADPVEMLRLPFW